MKNQGSEPIFIGSSSVNTCVCCGRIIPEGVMVCQLCHARVVGGRIVKKDLERELRALPMGFANIYGVTIYKTFDGTYKLSNYDDGVTCLSLEKAVSVLSKSIKRY